MKKVVLVLVVKVYVCVRITVRAIQSVVHVAAKQGGGVSTAVDRVPMGDSVMDAKKFATALLPVCFVIIFYSDFYQRANLELASL